MKKLGFGLMRLPLIDKNNPKSIDLDTVIQMTDTFIENGFTYFDTAYMYHNYQSEHLVKKALVERYNRDSYLLATKLPTMFLKQSSDQPRIFNEQLEKCGVDYFDYYLLHSLGTENYKIAQSLDSFGFVAQMKKEGKIRHVGFSFHDRASVLDKILTDHPEVEFVQLQLNYLDWEDSQIQSHKCYDIAMKHGKKVIVMEPVKGGTLAKVPEKVEALFKQLHPHWSAASWAIRFAASLDGVMVVLSGMSSHEQMIDNVFYMRDFTPLDKKEYEILNQAVSIINAATAIACTNCGYCLERCPEEIPIPQYFALYNAEKRALNHLFSTQQSYYLNLTQTRSKASDCIGCRSCEQICPQHLNIADLLKKIAKAFE